MRSCTRSLLIAVLLLGAMAPALSRPADTVFRNGAVYTVNPAHPWAEAVAVSGGRIVFVGRNADVARHVGGHTRIVDLKGGMLLPGFHDAHCHLTEGGVDMRRCDLTECRSVADVERRIRDYARTHPKVAWVVGGGWGISLFPGCNPTRAQLDRLVPDRPAFLWASDGHNGWANTRALQLAGITEKTPDPPLGRIERDAHGRPSGTLREEACELVLRVLPEVAPEEMLAGYLVAQARAHSLGITAVQEAHAHAPVLTALRAADRSGRLTMRTVASLHTDPAQGPEQVDALVRERAVKTGPRLRLTAAKIFLDGVIETCTAAMLAPYTTRPTDSGILNFAPEALRALVTRLDREGFQVHIHAIGDRAIREALDALEAARAAHGPRDARPHIAHLQLIDAADLPRFAALGVTANFQAYWMQDNADSKVDRRVLGPIRYEAQYPMRSLFARGARVVGGSDWPVTTLNPLDAIEIAVTHLPLGDRRGAVYIPAERVSLARAIEAYTRNAAWLAFDEKTLGTIEVGKAADLVVLDRNLFRVPASQIHTARVRLTMIAGETVYRAPREITAARRP